MRAALAFYDRVPRLVALLIVLIVPGALLIAPVVMVWAQRARQVLASQQAATGKDF